MNEAIKGDVLTSARNKHKDVEITESSRGGISYEVAQVPIDWYLKRRHISKAEYRAANRIFTDWALSGQSNGVTANLTDAQVRGVLGQWRSLSEAQQGALDRWKKAIYAINGKIGQLMVINVCCYGYWLKDVNYLPYREAQAFPRFREALEDLLKHYDNNRNP